MNLLHTITLLWLFTGITVLCDVIRDMNKDSSALAVAVRGSPIGFAVLTTICLVFGPFFIATYVWHHLRIWWMVHIGLVRVSCRYLRDEKSFHVQVQRDVWVPKEGGDDE